MNWEALRQARRVMIEVQQQGRTLAMGDWMRHALGVDSVTGLVTASCGSAGCLAGWCLTDPWFIDRGFHGYSGSGGEFVFPRYKMAAGMSACAEFFDMDDDDVEGLFHPDGYPSFPSSRVPVEAVIAKIDEYLERAEP